MGLPYIYQFEAIGTQWSIETDTPLSSSEKAQIQSVIHNFDHSYSRFLSDSLVSQARQNAPGSFEFPESIVPIFDTYLLLEKATKGAVNPLIGENLEQLGYDATYSLHPTTGDIVRPPSLAKAITRADSTLTYHHPVLLDIGAIGKGYIVDQVAHLLTKTHPIHVVDAGGDMAIATQYPYTVGFEHPYDFSQVIGYVTLNAMSICGSSTNRRRWGDGLHHVIDGVNGKPAQTDIIATWAIAHSTMIADALSTALFFVPAADLMPHFHDFQYVIMKADMSVEHNIYSSGKLYTDTQN